MTSLLCVACRFHGRRISKHGKDISWKENWIHWWREETILLNDSLRAQISRICQFLPHELLRDPGFLPGRKSGFPESAPFETHGHGNVLPLRCDPLYPKIQKIINLKQEINQKVPFPNNGTYYVCKQREKGRKILKRYFVARSQWTIFTNVLLIKWKHVRKRGTESATRKKDPKSTYQLILICLNIIIKN